MKEWHEILRTGKFVDKNGKDVSFTTSDLDAIVASYDPSKLEAPIVVGHPKDNEPAYGWVEQIKRVGETLLAKFKDIDQGFQELLDKGRYRYKSVKLAGSQLVHVGFLGAVPPAVGGLKPYPVALSSMEGSVIELGTASGSVVTRLLRGVRDFFIDKFSLDEADRVLPVWELDSIDQVPVVAGNSVSFSQPTREENFDMNELEQAKARIAQHESKITELSNQVAAVAAENTVLKTENKALKDAAAAVAAAAQKAELSAFVGGLVKEGKLKPADVDGHVAVMLGLSGVADVELSAGVKVSPLQRYRETLSALPKVLPTSEFAQGSEALPGASQAASQIETKIREKMTANKELSYGEAFRLVQIENPDIASALKPV